jgi:hypothetical protein
MSSFYWIDSYFPLVPVTHTHTHTHTELTDMYFEIITLYSIMVNIRTNIRRWNMKDQNNEEILIKKKKYRKIYKITEIMMGSTCNQNGHNKNF